MIIKLKIQYFLAVHTWWSNNHKKDYHPHRRRGKIGQLLSSTLKK